MKVTRSKDGKQITRSMSVPKERFQQLKNKPGASNLGKYKRVKAKDTAGTVTGTFPINTKARAISALKLAHNDANPASVKAKVYAKYPSLRPKKRKS